MLGTRMLAFRSGRCWLILVWIFALFHQSYSAGSSCAWDDRDQLSKGKCPSLCSKANCASTFTKAYTEADSTHLATEVTTNGYLLPDNVTYVENRIIVLENEEQQKVYLNIKEEFTSSIPHTAAQNDSKRLYLFSFISSKPVEWIVSYNINGAQYKFWGQEESSLVASEPKAHFTNQIPLDGEKVKTRIPEQLKNDICDNLQKKDKKITSNGGCIVSSYLKIKQADVIDVTVGYLSATDGDRVPESSNRFSITSRHFSSPFQSCPNNIAPSEKPKDVLVLSFANTSDVDIRLLLLDAYKLDRGTSKTLLLLADGNVTWRMEQSLGEPISGDLNVIVSSHCFLDYSKLKFGENSGSLTKTITNLNGGSNLDLILRKNSFSVNDVAYVKYSSVPDLVEFQFPEAEEFGIFDEWFIAEATRTRKCFATHMEISISCSVFEDAGIHFSKFIAAFGNGKCEFKAPTTQTEDFVFSVNKSCGLYKRDFDEMAVNVFMDEGTQNSIAVRCPKTDESTSVIHMKTYKDLEQTELVAFPHNITRLDNTFYTTIEIGPQSMANTYNLHIEECYLSTSSRIPPAGRHAIILNNCPVDESTRFLQPRGKDMGQQHFHFSIKKLLEANFKGLFNLTCVFSKCISKHCKPEISDSAWNSSTIPKCMHEDGAFCDASEAVANYDKLVTRNVTLGPFRLSFPAELPQQAKANSSEVEEGGPIGMGVTIVLIFVGTVCGVVTTGALCHLKYRLKKQRAARTNSSTYRHVNNHSDSNESSTVGVAGRRISNASLEVVPCVRIHCVHCTHSQCEDNLKARLVEQLGDEGRTSGKLEDSLSHSQVANVKRRTKEDSESADSGLAGQNSGSSVDSESPSSSLRQLAEMRDETSPLVHNPDSMKEEEV